MMMTMSPVRLKIRVGRRQRSPVNILKQEQTVDSITQCGGRWLSRDPKLIGSFTNDGLVECSSTDSPRVRSSVLDLSYKDNDGLE